ncbi:hypothetical protein FQN50_007583 [Emmonsiellopsis sp. PD_5]|nr:hypothetical protein FQN50_007583 [Emmonsiellopsis sp. PD_5]
MDSELESSPPPDVSPPPDFSPPPEFSPLNQPFPPLEPSPPTESSPSARSSPSVQLFSGQMPGLNLELFSKGLLWIVDRLTSLTVTNCTRLVIMKYEDELDALSGGGGEDSPELRAMAACQAYKILYGQYAITPDHSSYKEAMQANWLVAASLLTHPGFKMQAKTSSGRRHVGYQLPVISDLTVPLTWPSPLKSLLNSSQDSAFEVAVTM